MGGNLTNLVHLLGTSFEPDWDGVLLFIEDISEPAYKIDRMLTQLKMTARLSQVSGILLGEFLTSDGEEIPDMHLVTKRVLELTDETVPVWSQFPVSHGPENVVLPLGIRVNMNSETKTLTFSEPCFQD